MAFCIGAALRRQVTVRPDLVRLTSPASDNTSRCFMIAGSDTSNGSASTLTERSGCAASRATNARRVGSASAAKVRSSGSELNLTIWLSIEAKQTLSSLRRPKNDSAVGVVFDDFVGGVGRRATLKDARYFVVVVRKAAVVTKLMPYPSVSCCGSGSELWNTTPNTPSAA